MAGSIVQVSSSWCVPSCASGAAGRLSCLHTSTIYQPIVALSMSSARGMMRSDERDHRALRRSRPAARAADRPGPRLGAVAGVPDRPRPGQPPPRRRPAGRAADDPGRVRRPAPAGRGARSPAPDEPAGGRDLPEPERGDPADRPARGRRARRPEPLRVRRPRRRGRPDRRGLARLRQASRTHLRGIEAYFLDSVEPVDLEAIERSCSAIGDRVRADGRGRRPAASRPDAHRPRSAAPPDQAGDRLDPDRRRESGDLGRIQAAGAPHQGIGARGRAEPSRSASTNVAARASRRPARPGTRHRCRPG